MVASRGAVSGKPYNPMDFRFNGLKQMISPSRSILHADPGGFKLRSLDFLILYPEKEQPLEIDVLIWEDRLFKSAFPKKLSKG